MHRTVENALFESKNESSISIISAVDTSINSKIPELENKLSNIKEKVPEAGKESVQRGIEKIKACSTFINCPPPQDCYDGKCKVVTTDDCEKKNQLLCKNNIRQFCSPIDSAEFFCNLCGGNSACDKLYPGQGKVCLNSPSNPGTSECKCPPEKPDFKDGKCPKECEQPGWRYDEVLNKCLCTEIRWESSRRWPVYI